MNNLKAGFARIDVTPMLGITMSGYFETRYAEGALDPLELSALAVSCGDTTALLLSLDNLGIRREIILDFKESITAATNVPAECIYIHATHTHTGPTLQKNSDEVLVQEYLQFLTHKMAFAAKAAIEDMKPAKMGWAVGKAPDGVAFIRRFRMKDGSVMTNPGLNNPNVLEPLTKLDDQVNILRFDRENAKTIVLANFGNHPAVVGNKRFSADWPGFLRKTVEQALPECSCIFFTGCEGDVNHINVFPTDTYRPLAYDPKGRHDYARYMGRAMAGTVLQEYDKVKYVDVDSIRCLQRTLQIPSNQADPKDLPEAHRLADRYYAGEIKELREIYPGMLFETVVGEAKRMVELEHGPEFFEMDMSVLAIGNVAFVGFPGESFTDMGVAVKKAPGWDVILPTCLTNGWHGYFPMMDAYLEGGYEARTSRFKAGAAEKMVEAGLEMLNELKNK